MQSPKGLRPRFPGWERGSRGVGGMGPGQRGIPVSFSPVGKRPCQPRRETSPPSRKGASGLGRPPGIAGSIENPGSGPHPGLPGSLLLRPSHSFICSFILRIHPAAALWAAYPGSGTELGVVNTAQMGQGEHLLSTRTEPKARPAAPLPQTPSSGTAPK